MLAYRHHSLVKASSDGSSELIHPFIINVCLEFQFTLIKMWLMVKIQHITITLHQLFLCTQQKNPRGASWAKSGLLLCFLCKSWIFWSLYSTCFSFASFILHCRAVNWENQKEMKSKHRKCHYWACSFDAGTVKRCSRGWCWCPMPRAGGGAPLDRAVSPWHAVTATLLLLLLWTWAVISRVAWPGSKLCSEPNPGLQSYRS